MAATKFHALFLSFLKIRTKRERKRKRRNLQPDGMPRFETKGHARGRLPARRPTAGGIVRRGGIESKTGDDRESVTVSSIDCDPFPGTATSVSAQLFRAQRRAHQTGTRQSIGNGGGTIISAVIKGAMAAAVPIRFRAQLIGRPDGALNRERCVHRCQRERATKPRLIAWSGGSG